MFFILSKTLSFLLSPFLWVIGLWIAFVFCKSSRTKTRFFWIALSCTVFFSNGYIVGKLVALWEIPGMEDQNIKPYDIGIVLSGMFEYNKDLERLSARRGSDRLWQAIQLYHKGKIRKILLSGESGYVFKDGLHEAKQLKKILVNQQIPSEDILIESNSRNTHENAQETVHFLNKNGYMKASSFLLITSSIHMRRAQLCFFKEGLECDVYTTDHYYIAENTFSINAWIPSASAFVMWERIIKEWMGTLMYRISGYI